jgi:cell division protein ZapA
VAHMEPVQEQVVTVTIFKRTFPVRSGDNPEYVHELARYVDEKMSELAEQTLTVDTLKIAILAALNIADDYISTREELEQFERRLSESTSRLTELLASPFQEVSSS